MNRELHPPIVPQPPVARNGALPTLIGRYGCASLRRGLASRRPARETMSEGFDAVRGVVLDLDGTVYDDRGLIPGADLTVPALRAAGVRLRFATNTSRHPRGALVERLRSLGVDAHADEVVTAPRAAAAWLTDRGLTRISLHVVPAIVEEFAGFTLDERAPEVAVVGDLGDDWSVDRLNRVFRHVLGGARLLAIQKNRYWRRGGALCLDAGPFVAALEFATGTTAEVAGKPSPPFFASAAASIDLALGQVAVVGDDIHADVRGALAAGALGVLVRTGKFQPADLDADGPAPTLVIPSIAELPSALGL